MNDFFQAPPDGVLSKQLLVELSEQDWVRALEASERGHRSVGVYRAELLAQRVIGSDFLVRCIHALNRVGGLSPGWELGVVRFFQEGSVKGRISRPWELTTQGIDRALEGLSADGESSADVVLIDARDLGDFQLMPALPAGVIWQLTLGAQRLAPVVIGDGLGVRAVCEISLQIDEIRVEPSQAIAVVKHILRD